MPGKKPKRSSVGSNQITPMLSGPPKSMAAQSAVILPPELQGLPRLEVIRRLSSFATCDSSSSLTLRRLSITSNSWREEFHRVGVFKRAMIVMLRNAYLSVACALLTNYLCSIGTLSTKPPKEQSYTRFLAATMFWTHFSFCLAVLLIQASALVGHHFLANALVPATFYFCLRQLYNKTYLSYCGSLILLMATTYGVGKLLPIESHTYKLEFYLACLSGHIYTTNAIVSARRIFQLQTIEGLSYAGREAASAHTLLERAWYFAAVFVKFSGLALAVASAGGFVHLVQHFHISSFVESSALVGGCIAFKLLVQEVTKMCIFSRKQKEIRTMWIAIGVPSVLVDTQVRMALQRSDSLTITLVGFASMALVEICMRTIKVALTKLEIQWHEKRSFPMSVSAAIRQFRQEQVERHDCMHRRDSSTAAMRLKRWKERVLSFHTAKIYAGMAAQYIAIGCSTSLLSLYWSHAKYELRFVADQGNNASYKIHEIELEWNLAAFLVVQFGAEVVVDYLSSLLEIGVGIDFDELRKYGPFVACVFMCMTIVNVQISAIMYIRVD